MKKSIFCIISALIIVTLVLSSCGSADTEGASSANAENVETADLETVVYEAVFVDNELVANLFAEVRGDGREITEEE